MKISLHKKFCLTFLIIGALAATTSAQDEPVYHLKLAYETQPTGPNETFYVRLILVEHTIDVGAYQLLIGFDQSMGHLVAIHNNLGSNGNGTGSSFLLNAAESPLSGVSYADTSREIQMYNTMAIQPPFDPNDDFNLGQLEFLTTAGYSSTQGQFGVYLTADGKDLGFYDGNVDAVLVECASLNPVAAVADWAIY